MQNRAFWLAIESSDVPLAQGEYLPDCAVPVVPDDFDPSPEDPDTSFGLNIARYDLVVVTQSCDLANGKAPSVACCRAYSLQEFEAANPKLKLQGSAWEQVRQGRREGLHLLGAPDNSDDNRKAICVNFREIHSLPIRYLSRWVALHPRRLQLNSPFLEHFSQAFARFFMRVGLPSQIEPYK